MNRNSPPSRAGIVRRRRPVRGADRRGRRRRAWLWRSAVALAATTFALLAWVYLTLPDVRPLRTANPETTALIELRRSEARVSGRPPLARQQWVPYERIAPDLRRAVLVAEDDAFFEHDGIDTTQLKDAIEATLRRGRPLRGASTITQQLAKNLYLSPSRTPLRKLRELLISRRLEAELDKPRILELYLNVIEWGDGVYGAEAASRAYFGKPASALTRAEAALLAAAIVNPRVHSPAHPTARLRRRQQIILRRMAQESAEGNRRLAPITTVEPDGRPADSEWRIADSPIGSPRVAEA